MAAKLAKNPTDRGKAGSKVHLLVDERGAPLAIFVTGANEHDKWSADDLIVHIVAKRPNSEQHFCADKGYDYEDVYQFVGLQNYIEYIKHRRRRNEPKEECSILGEKSFPARRWVVGRTFSWLAKRRSIATRCVISLITGFGLRYRLVGGMRERYFIGNRFKPRKLPENAQTPRARQDGSQENCRPRGCGTHEL